MKRTVFLCFVSFLLLAGCVTITPTPPADEEERQPEAPVSAEEDKTPVIETKNVIYKGIVKPAGISIYQEGSHRLMLEDGRFILLESADVDLNGYVNESVKVFGALRPTVEAGGMIMRVETVQLVVEEEVKEETAGEEASPQSSSSSDSAEQAGESDEEATEEDPSESSSSESAAAQETEEEQASSEAGQEDESDSEVSEESSSSSSSQEEPSTSPELDARTVKMASESFTPDQWTQKYCTGHIGFCIPVHRNWWFNSFGTTTSYLWHVEVSSEEVLNLFNGPIHVNLISGTIGAKKATDGQVRVQGNMVFGYREWTENRHFEITAPVALEEAVRYITENLVEYEEIEN